MPPKCGRRTPGVVVVVPDCRIQKHRLAALGLAMVCFAPLSCRVYMISLGVLGRVEGLPPSLSPRFWARNDAAHRRSVLENDCYSMAAKCRSFGLCVCTPTPFFLRRRQQPFYFLFYVRPTLVARLFERDKLSCTGRRCLNVHPPTVCLNCWTCTPRRR